METFHRVEQRRTKPVPPTRSDERLPIGRSAAVITMLSSGNSPLPHKLRLTVARALVQVGIAEPPQTEMRHTSHGGLSPGTLRRTATSAGWVSARKTLPKSH